MAVGQEAERTHSLNTDAVLSVCLDHEAIASGSRFWKARRFCNIFSKQNRPIENRRFFAILGHAADAGRTTPGPVTTTRAISRGRESPESLDRQP
jgi:hypothetical protein